MHAPLKLIFGENIKQQVAARIQRHIEEEFKGNCSRAAKSLKFSRQRLFSYTRAKNLPRPPIFDLFLQEWGLNLLGETPRRDGETSSHATIRGSQPVQGSLFDKPVTLKSDELKVVIKRKGPHLVASIEISTDVEIA